MQKDVKSKFMHQFDLSKECVTYCFQGLYRCIRLAVQYKQQDKKAFDLILVTSLVGSWPTRSGASRQPQNKQFAIPHVPTYVRVDTHEVILVFAIRFLKLNWTHLLLLLFYLLWNEWKLRKSSKNLISKEFECPWIILYHKHLELCLFICLYEFHPNVPYMYIYPHLSKTLSNQMIVLINPVS